MKKNRSQLQSIAKKGSFYDGIFEVAFISAILPVAFLSSVSVALTSASL
ncbi:MAG: hypothetical protein R3189_07655 [Thiomicrorhabdus chilensis]|nr:hypothetical protein [Thiomicrorhabdus chilensis]MDX1348110.1 hypothetical protein [Thiomicrorhabdus chilensis]